MTLFIEGTVVAVASDSEHAFSKPQKNRIRMIKGHGVEADVHAGPLTRHRYLVRRALPNLRQVHLIGYELFDELRKEGFEISAGQLGENVTTRGLTLEELALGTVLFLGNNAQVEITGLRTPCVLIDRFRPGLKRRMRTKADRRPSRCGVLGVVRADGWVSAGDRVTVASPGWPHRPLPFL